MISLAIEWGGTTYQWHSATIVGFFCGGGLALVTFGLWEFRVGDAVAMIPWSIVRKRQVWTSCFYLGFFSGSMLVYSYYLPIYFQAVKDVSPTLSGVYMLSGIGPQLVMAIGSGVISKCNLWLKHQNPLTKWYQSARQVIIFPGRLPVQLLSPYPQV